MSKKFREKLCAYCAKNISIPQGDHLFAREFFLENDRNDLIKVPACDKCNNEKSRIEHYLTTILPFGGLHADAEQNLSAMVPKRLSKNKRLHSDLQLGMKYKKFQNELGFEFHRLTIPFDGKKYAELFKYLAKGLAWHHWGTYIQNESIVFATSLSSYGVEQFEHFFLFQTPNRVVNTVGNNVFKYTGIQTVDNDQITFWLFQVYNGLLGAEEVEGKYYGTSIVGSFTGPLSKMSGFVEVFSS